MTIAHRRTFFKIKKPVEVPVYIRNYPFFVKICEFYLVTQSGTDDRDIKTVNEMPLTFFSIANDSRKYEWYG